MKQAREKQREIEIEIESASRRGDRVNIKAKGIVVPWGKPITLTTLREPNCRPDFASRRRRLAVSPNF
ncbi:hypothetical protein M0804_014623 [Polistes exclamans]|nr:hypothetical protein M0804_014623 [Polistes exclamans]